MSPQIVVVGLGPGDPQALTREAWSVLEAGEVLYLRTGLHPLVPHLPGHLRLETFDPIYERGQEFGQVYREIVERLLAAEPPVLYGVPGHPLVAEATTRLLLQRLGQGQVRIVAGLSFLEPTCTLLGLDPLEEGVCLLDALALAAPTSPFDLPLQVDPTRPLLIAQLHDRIVASGVKLALMEHYPDEHPVTLVRAAGVPGQEERRDLSLYELDHDDLDSLCTLYVPPLERLRALREGATLEWLCAHLRGPEGCPWDRKQDHTSLRQGLLEETYEVLEAIDRDDLERLGEELGDLLLQVVLQAQLGREEGAFTLADVVERITRKLIRRHPHVFGPLQVRDSAEACRNWEAIKAEERDQAGRGEASLLDGVPVTLPALAYAQEVGRRVARVGFDWETIAGVWEKVAEEMEELRQARTPQEQAAELGDLLFSLVNLARRLGVDAEDALRKSNAKFRRRFERIEATARARGLPLRDLGLAQMDAIWEEARAEEQAPSKDGEDEHDR